MRETDALLWHVYAADGELLGKVKYAIDAARMAMVQGEGTMVRNGSRLMLDVQERDPSWEAADAAAKAMIAAAYGRP